MRTLFAFVLAASPAVAQAPKVAAIKPGAKVAIVGDSITEQKLYSRYVAGYLAACQPQLDVRVAQFGWSGERAGGFLARMDNDLMPFQPDVVTLCYGMNDGEYRAYAADIGKRYETPLTAIVGKLKAAGATVVVGSPGCVDQYFFRRKPDEKTSAFAATYNDNLAHLRDIAKSAAAAADMPFADVHDAMREAMLKAQAKLGDKYHVCGSDGFHPAPNGQLAMAYAFLKATDLSGDLGTITIDMTGESKAENGHKVVEAKEGVVKVESRRYPFAHPGSATDPNGTRSIAPFLPFDAEFNRLTLVVKNAPADKLDVTWGDETKAFTRDELAKGVNLATAFANHPLAAAFRKVDAAVTDQQNFQTFMIKQVITNHRQLLAAAKGDAELAAALKAVVARTWAIDAAKAAAVKAAVVPVTHTITVKAAG